MKTTYVLTVVVTGRFDTLDEALAAAQTVPQGLLPSLSASQMNVYTTEEPVTATQETQA